MSELKHKHTLANKLSKIRVQQLRSEQDLNVPDIEEAASIGTRLTKSVYFSPVQTRQQRRINRNPPKDRQLSDLKTEQGQTLKDDIVQSKREELSPKAIDRTVAEANEAKDKFAKAIKKVKGQEAASSNLCIQWEPQHWRQILKNIRQMRSNATAPVDYMGCHKCADDTANEKTQRFQKLVALMLSSQTKDETTFAAMQRLKVKGLTPESITSMQASNLEELLHPVSFYKMKAKHLQQTAHLLIGKYDGDIPNTIKELLTLPGVGPKMAHICMATAWNEVTGIGVDVHVHRITNRLRWLPKETKEPEQTRVALEAWLPRDLWQEVNHLLVGFGQTICTPVRPHCGDCLNRDICPSANKTTNKQKPKEMALEQHDLSPSKKPKFQKKKIV